VKIMSIRSERIKSLIEECGKSYQELEKITGIKKSSLQRYASGATAKIPLDVIEKLSRTFNVSKEYLMGWEEERTRFTHSMEVHSVATSILEQINSPDQMVLTEGEKMLIELFRQIPEDAQKMYLEVLRASLKNQP
jgi:transcriptional regulator with XRE-family HTH domain